MTRFYLLLLISFFCFANSAQAQGVATFSYQRSELSILRANPPLLPLMPWSDEEKSTQTEASEKKLSVDIRPAKALYQQEGWIDLAGLSGLNGLFFVFDKPTAAHVPNMTIYVPLDVLWINAEGKIITIAPNLNLSTLTSPIFGSAPAKAILLLAGGTCEREFIAPNDRIISPDFFTPPPNILTAPQ